MMSASRLELTRYGWLKAMLKSRLLQPALMLISLFFFVLAILTGFFGTPAGHRPHRLYQFRPHVGRHG